MKALMSKSTAQKQNVPLVLGQAREKSNDVQTPQIFINKTKLQAMVKSRETEDKMNDFKAIKNLL